MGPTSSNSVNGAAIDPYPSYPPNPVRREVMRMWWRNLTFLHWRVDAAEVQALLPSPLTVDTFDGDAWIALVPFEMEVLLPGGRPIPREGRFPETNVRTYVRGPDGTPGVWFCSLEAGRLSATIAARTTYGLPYFWAQMDVASSGAVWTYGTTRRWPGPRGVHSSAAVRVGEPIPVEAQSPLERFLTARWGLFSTFGVGPVKTTLYAPVHHEPWPLHRAELLDVSDELVAAAGLVSPDAEPVVHWTPGVEVRVGRPHRV